MGELYTSSKPVTLLKKRLWHRYFPVNFAKSVKTTSLIEPLQPLVFYIRSALIRSRILSNFYSTYCLLIERKKLLWQKGICQTTDAKELTQTQTKPRNKWHKPYIKPNSKESRTFTSRIFPLSLNEFSHARYLQFVNCVLHIKKKAH